MKRKLIMLITACPEEPYQQHVFKGVFEQCAKYGYNVAVFACNVPNSNFHGDYQDGEMNIYNLPNFDKADGIIVTTVPISDNHRSRIEGVVLERLKKNEKAKVVSLDLPIPIEGSETVCVNDIDAFEAITEHLISVHNCKNIYCLTGYENIDVSKNRLKGYRNILEKYGIEYDESKVFYGDFWYGGGERLADKILSGEVNKPDAVVCANDYMATGLVNKLTDNGIRVPEDIIVTGYDAISEAFLNRTSITTFSPDIYSIGAEAVNAIRKNIEPDKPLEEVARPAEYGMVYGKSCGCHNTNTNIKHFANSFLYHINRGYNLIDAQDPNDIARLTNSFMYENLISSKDADEMLIKLDMYTYLIKPFSEFFLVLRDDWMNMSKPCQVGYPDTMLLKIHRTVAHETEPREHDSMLFSPDDKKGERLFDTKLMLEDLYEDSEEAHAFFFSPVHFEKDTLGYTVLKCDLLQEIKIATVYRNWLRDASNALEMSRIRARLVDDSYEDQLTKLFNRRGMYSRYNKKLGEGLTEDVCVIMVDMDNLKYINDTFGHDEGDFGIKAIATAIKNNTRREDICVRSGGDEFLIIGFGNNMEGAIREKIERIRDAVENVGISAKKPYPLTASFGYVVQRADVEVELDDLIKVADARMYEEKKAKKAARNK